MKRFLLTGKMLAAVCLVFFATKSGAQTGLLSGGSLTLYGSTSGNVTLALPSGLAESFTLTLPERQSYPVVSYLYDSAGTLKWGVPTSPVPGDLNFNTAPGAVQTSSSNSNYLFNVSYAPGATGPLKGAVLVAEIRDKDNGPSVAAASTVAAHNTNAAATNVNVTGVIVNVSNAGSGTQIGLQAECYGYLKNYAMLLNGGNVGIGTSTPVQPLEVNGNIRISGTNGLKITEWSGTAATAGTMGTAVLVAGTKAVATTSVTANSRIFLTTQTPGGTLGRLYVSARVGGTSFTITSTSATDVSTVGWMIVEPGP